MSFSADTLAALDRLLPALARREETAFAALYEILADRLFASAYRSLRDAGAAEDAVQQAFLELVRSEFRPADGRALTAWLFKSVRYSVLDEVRRRRRKPETPADTLPEVAVDAEPDLGLDPEVERGLAALTPTQRLVLHLKHVEGLDGQEIAEILGSNRVAVYAMAARAEARLQKLIDPRRIGWIGGVSMGET